MESTGSDIPTDWHPSGQTTNTVNSIISSKTEDSKDIKAFGNYTAQNNLTCHANKDIEGIPPYQRGAYTHPPQGAHLTKAPHIRERFLYNPHHNQYYHNHAGRITVGSVRPPPPPPPPPQGYAYNPSPTTNYHSLTPATTYQRFTFIIVCSLAITSLIVCCLAITSLLQISFGGRSPFSGGQQNVWNGNSWIPVNNNSPYYYNTRNGMAAGNGMKMNRIGSMNNDNNNMIQMNGNGNEVGMNTQNQQQVEDNANIPISESEDEGVVPLLLEDVVSDPGIEKYPLTELSHFKDNWDEWDETDVPMFFHTPRAGDSTVENIMTMCHRFVMATEMGITDGHADDQELTVVRAPFQGEGLYSSVNVDTTTVEGVARAQEMGFADSGLADAVLTNLLYEANELFTTTAKGRIFTVFRHPIERAMINYHHVKRGESNGTDDPSLKEMTIIEYADSHLVENNWLTRQLSNTPEGDLTDEHFNLAMEVVRRKVMVGLMSEIEATMERYERLFRWKFHLNPKAQENCRERQLSDKEPSLALTPGSKAFKSLSLQNNYDLLVYEYAESVFVEQEQFVADIEVDYRNVDGTCCRCDQPTYPPDGFNLCLIEAI